MEQFERRIMGKFTEKQAEKQIRQGARKITQSDLQKVLEKHSEILEIVSGDNPLRKFLEDVKLLFSLVNDYFKGTYREIPWWSIAAVVTALLYVLSPVDLIPDPIPIIGYVDDALIVGACLAMIENDLQNYKEWKMKNA